MLISDLNNALDAFDSSGHIIVDALFPHLRFGYDGTFVPLFDVGWNPTFLRLFAEIEAAAAYENQIINLKAALGLPLDKLDSFTGSVTLPKSCRSVMRRLSAECAHRCELCGARN